MKVRRLSTRSPDFDRKLAALTRYPGEGEKSKLLGL